MTRTPAPTQQPQRRLAAILLVNVVGYGRLEETDAIGTVNRLAALLDAVIAPALRASGGRIVQRTGDGALSELSGVTPTLQTAGRIQAETAGNIPDA